MPRGAGRARGPLRRRGHDVQRADAALKLSAISDQRSAISDQRSAISDQRSAISDQGKYWDAKKSSHTLKARDYPDVARAAIREMHRQVGDLVVDDEGLAKRGLLVRHLVMPGELDETRSILGWLAEDISPRTYVNVMDQYYPAGRVADEPERYRHLARRLTVDEHLSALRIARDVGLDRIDTRQPHRKLGRRLRTF